MDELKPCPFCERPLYIKVTRYLRPILAPLTHADALRDELINITGEDFAPINAEYCPMCGRPLNRRVAPENKPLTCEGCKYEDGIGKEYPCVRCKRRYGDHYARKPEKKPEQEGKNNG